MSRREKYVSFALTVDGFRRETNLPAKNTCDGEDIPPAVHWSGEPEQTKSFAMIMDDPDAPSGAWTHWLVWDIPTSIHELPEGDGHAIPAKIGINDFGRRGYGGPCPPKGRGPHRYFFRLFALDTPSLGLSPGARRSAVEAALRKHAIAETAYMGRYERH